MSLLLLLTFLCAAPCSRAFFRQASWQLPLENRHVCHSSRLPQCANYARNTIPRSFSPLYSQASVLETADTFRRPLSPADLSIATDITIESCNAVLQECSIAGNWKGAEQVILLMNERNISPDESTYSHVMQTYLTGNQLVSAEEQAIEMLRAGYLPDRSMLCSLMVLLGKADFPHRAERLFYKSASETKQASNLQLYESIILAWFYSNSADKYSMIEDLYDRVIFLSLTPTANMVLPYLFAHTHPSLTRTPDKAYSVYAQYGDLLDSNGGYADRQQAVEYLLTSCRQAISSRRMQAKVMHIVHMVMASLPVHMYTESIRNTYMSILSCLGSEESLHKSLEVFRLAMEQDVKSPSICDMMVKKCIQAFRSPSNSSLSGSVSFVVEMLLGNVLPAIRSHNVSIPEDTYVLAIQTLSHALTPQHMTQRVIQGVVLYHPQLQSSVRIWNALLDSAMKRGGGDRTYVQDILTYMRDHNVGYNTNTYELLCGYYLHTGNYEELDKLMHVVIMGDIENADSTSDSVLLKYIHTLSVIQRDDRKENIAVLLPLFSSLCKTYLKHSQRATNTSAAVVYMGKDNFIRISHTQRYEELAYIHHVYSLMLQYPHRYLDNVSMHTVMMHTLSHIHGSLTIPSHIPSYPYHINHDDEEGGIRPSSTSSSDGKAATFVDDGERVMVMDMGMEILQHVQQLVKEDTDLYEEDFYIDFLQVLTYSLPIKSEYIVNKAYDLSTHLYQTYSASNFKLSAKFYIKLFTLFANSQRNHTPKLVDTILARIPTEIMNDAMFESLITVYAQGRYLPSVYNKIINCLHNVSQPSILSRHTMETLVVYFFEKWQNAHMNSHSLNASPVSQTEEYANLFLHYYILHNERYDASSKLYFLFLQYWVTRGQVDIVLYSLTQLSRLRHDRALVPSPLSLIASDVDVIPPTMNYTHFILMQPTAIHLSQPISRLSITFYSALSKSMKKLYDSRVNVVYVYYEYLRKLKQDSLPASHLHVAYNLIFFAYGEDIDLHMKNQHANKANSLVDDMYNLFVSMLLDTAEAYPSVDHSMFHAVLKALLTTEKPLSTVRAKKIDVLVDRYVFQQKKKLDARTFHQLMNFYDKTKPTEAFQMSSKLLPYIYYPANTNHKKVIEQVVLSLLDTFGHKHPLLCSQLVLQCLEAQVYLDSLVINQILSHLLHYAYSSSTNFMYPNTTSLAQYVYYSEALVAYCYKLGLKISSTSYQGIFQLIMSAQHNNTADMAPALYKAFSKIEFTGSMMDKYILVHFYHSLLKLIDAAEYSHKIAQYAMQAYHTSIQGGVIPNLQVYHLLLQILGRSKVVVVPYVDILLRDMVDKFNVLPDIVTYNMALQCYVKSNLPYADARIDNILQNMQRRKLYPTLVTYSILLQSVSGGLHKAKPKEHHVELAGKIFNNMLQAGITPDIKAWTIYITIWCESDVENKEEQVLGMLKQMEASGVYPNFITYSAMLSMWGTSKHPQASLQVRSILVRMRKENMHLDQILFSTMLSALSKSRTPESHTRALEILDSMSANHVTPNAFHYAAVMNMYVHSNSTDRESVVMGLFDRMKKENCVPNAVVYSLMLHVLRNSTLPHAQDEVLKIYNALLDSRISLDSRLVHNLLHALLQHFPHSEVYSNYMDKLIRHTVNYELYIEKDAFKPLLRLFDLPINLKKQLTLQVIQWMEMSKLQYDDTSVYQLCINNLCDISRFETDSCKLQNFLNLDKMLQVMNKKRLTLEMYVYSKYCRMCIFASDSSRLDWMRSWLEHMVDRKVILETDVLRGLVRLHSINGSSSNIDFLNNLVLYYIESPQCGVLSIDTVQYMMNMWTRQTNATRVLECSMALMEVMNRQVLTRTINMSSLPGIISNHSSVEARIVNAMVDKEHFMIGNYSAGFTAYDAYLSTLLSLLPSLRSNPDLKRRFVLTFSAIMGELVVMMQEYKKNPKSRTESSWGMISGTAGQLVLRIEGNLKRIAQAIK